MIAGGTESMSMVPLGGHCLRPNPRLFTSDKDHIALAFGMGLTAEKVAARWQIPRSSQEQFALESHRRAVAAIDEGEFTDEIVPYPLEREHPDSSQPVFVGEDEGPRRDTNLDSMARLKPVFKASGSVTAATSSQMSDGAAAVLVVSEEFCKKYALTPMARLCHFMVTGVAPEIMGIGPISAIEGVLKRAQMDVAQVDWIELNEAFAAQSLAVMKALQLPAEKVNPLGGAIALGHPLGATGAIRKATLLHGLRRRQQHYGMVSMCIGSGMGAAALFECMQS